MAEIYDPDMSHEEKIDYHLRRAQHHLDMIAMFREKGPVKTPPFFQEPRQPIPSPERFVPMLDRCSVCGLDLTKPLGYVCMNSTCPTGHRST